ncbi:MAG TPA: cytochrome P450, partial [Mycobacterium sp.]|nr:cytochrome P450 [Mycobacterium sp.]
MTTAADSQALLLHLLDPSNRADPYPTYAQIRERGPLQLPGMTLNVFSSFQDCD